MNLEGKVAVVTGASSGIGMATATALAASGAHLVLTARRQDKLDELAGQIEAAGGSALTIAGDITAATTAQQVVAAAMERFGTVDVLVNNAGYAPPMPLLELDEEVWDATVDTCLKSVYLMTRAVLPIMLDKGEGRIVQISSVAGKNGYENRTAYCAAKWGVQGFTEALRVEIAGSGVRLHTVHPGAVGTDWWAATDDPQSQEILERMMTADDVANAVVWLLNQPDNLQIDEVMLNNYRSPWSEG